MTRTITQGSLFALFLALGCGGDDGQGPSEDSSEASTDASTGDSTSFDTQPETTVDDDGSSTAGDTADDVLTTTDADSSDTGTDTESDVEVEVVVAFDPAAFELPEGLAIDGGEAIVGFAFTGAIERIALADGTRSPFATTPPPPPNTSFVTGVGLDDAGFLYAALVSFTDDATAGIYRAPAEGGEATLWASHEMMVFPNGLAWTDDGALFVTDSAYGGVFRIADDGTAEPWFADPLLAGDPTACGANGDLAVGANGLLWTPGALVVASSDQGVLVRIAIEDDGSAGAIETIAGPDCDALAGIDGIAFDAAGAVVAAINRADRIVRIDGGAIEVLAEGEPLAFPASLAFDASGDLYVTSFSLDDFLGGGDPTPALVRVSLP
jgi:sugar lactone lactonase YvrE